MKAFLVPFLLLLLDEAVSKKDVVLEEIAPSGGAARLRPLAKLLSNPACIIPEC